MKLAALFPKPSMPAIQALLSLALETWQSSQSRVSRVRMVCAGFGVKAKPEYPGDETVGCSCTAMLRPRS